MARCCGSKVFGISFSCAHCHGDAKQSMRGVAAQLSRLGSDRQAPGQPEHSASTCAARGTSRCCRCRPRAWSCSGSRPTWRINRAVCRSRRATAKELDAPRERGRQQYDQRIGQLNLSCALCHDQLPGQHAGRRNDPAGPRQRLPDLSPRVAGHGLAAAPPAQLPERRARRAAAVQLHRDGRTGAVPGAAQRRHEDRDARGRGHKPRLPSWQAGWTSKRPSGFPAAAGS